MSEPLLVSVRDAARALGIGRDSCYGLIREGRLRHISVGRRVLVPVSELADFIGREVVNDMEGVGNGTRPPTGAASRA